MTIAVRPQFISSFGATSGANFYLITNPSLAAEFEIEQDGLYQSYHVLPYGGDDILSAILQTDEPADILVISPDCFVTSVDPAYLGRRKLAVMAANSTPTSLEQIQHFIRVIEKSDPIGQREFADLFFNSVENADFLQICDRRYGTIAKFIHLDESYEWFEQGGCLDWGQQQILPSGELSVLPLAHGQYEFSRYLAINGEIVLQGFPIVHSGKVSFCREDQARIYQALSTLKDYAVIATVEDGRITQLQSTHPSAEPARLMLQALFDVDSRYRTIWELGFGINTQLELWHENAAMNEVYGAANGVLHWGLGLTPYTQYHLDLLCPYTTITTNQTNTTTALIGSW